MLKRETEGLCPAARSFCLQGILGEEAEGSALVWRQTWVRVPFPSSTSLDIGKVTQ